jgi:hypothetical protein
VPKTFQRSNPIHNFLTLCRSCNVPNKRLGLHDAQDTVSALFARTTGRISVVPLNWSQIVKDCVFAWSLACLGTWAVCTTSVDKGWKQFLTLGKGRVCWSSNC